VFLVYIPDQEVASPAPGLLPLPQDATWTTPAVNSRSQATAGLGRHCRYHAQPALAVALLSTAPGRKTTGKLDCYKRCPETPPRKTPQPKAGSLEPIWFQWEDSTLLVKKAYIPKCHTPRLGEVLV